MIWPSAGGSAATTSPSDWALRRGTPRSAPSDLRGAGTTAPSGQSRTWRRGSAARPRAARSWSPSGSPPRSRMWLTSRELARSRSRACSDPFLLSTSSGYGEPSEASAASRWENRWKRGSESVNAPAILWSTRSRRCGPSKATTTTTGSTEKGARLAQGAHWLERFGFLEHRRCDYPDFTQELPRKLLPTRALHRGSGQRVLPL